MTNSDTRNSDINIRDPTPLSLITRLKDAQCILADTGSLCTNFQSPKVHAIETIIILRVH